MLFPVLIMVVAVGWGITKDSKVVMGECAMFMNGDCLHPHISMTDGSYVCQFLFINDKADTRVARIRLDIMKCDKITTIPNVQSIHGLRLQKVPYTKYVFCNAEFIIPHPNDGTNIDNLDAAEKYTMYNAIDAETMEVA